MEAVVRENGRKITAELARSQFDTVPCTGNTLQLVVKDGPIDSSKTRNVIYQSKKIVDSFLRGHLPKNMKIEQKVLNIFCG